MYALELCLASFFLQYAPSGQPFFHPCFVKKVIKTEGLNTPFWVGTLGLFDRKNKSKLPRHWRPAVFVSCLLERTNSL